MDDQTDRTTHPPNPPQTQRPAGNPPREHPRRRHSPLGLLQQERLDHLQLAAHSPTTPPSRVHNHPRSHPPHPLPPPERLPPQTRTNNPKPPQTRTTTPTIPSRPHKHRKQGRLNQKPSTPSILGNLNTYFRVEVNHFPVLLFIHCSNSGCMN